MTSCAPVAANRSVAVETLGSRRPASCAATLDRAMPVRSATSACVKPASSRKRRRVRAKSTCAAYLVCIVNDTYQIIRVSVWSATDFRQWKTNRSRTKPPVTCTFFDGRVERI